MAHIQLLLIITCICSYPAIVESATKPVIQSPAKLVKITQPVKQPTRLESDQFAVQTKIINPHNFKYILNPGFQICGENNTDPVFLLIYVHTKPSLFARRTSIRETWARRSMFRDLRLIFMMGKTDEAKTNNLLKLESSTYNDIVQEDFVDSYRNLTYKGIMAMKWISTYCKKAEYILKVDDDIITNPFLILRHLDTLARYKIYQKKTVMCNVWSRMVVQRDKGNKWYLPKSEFFPDYFSPYCSGSAYIFTGDLATEMYEKSFYLKFLWIDDFYITGLLADAVNATHTYFNSMYMVNKGLVESTFMGKHGDHTIFGHIPDSINRMYKLWKYLLANQLSYHPSLKTNNARLLRKKDFTYIPDFNWSEDIWKPFLVSENPSLQNKSFFDYDSF